MKTIITLLLVSIITACASFNNAMTPGISIDRDAYTGAQVIYQPPVSAASSISEDAHLLGLRWDSNYPETYLLTVEVFGIERVTGLEFKADDEILTTRPFDQFTDRDIDIKYGSKSFKRFSVDRATMDKLARSKVVLMKVTQGSGYTVSSFGSDNSAAIINSKIAPFLNAVDTARAELQK